MAIKYLIFQSRLQNETRFIGRLVPNHCCDQDMLIDRMLSKGTSMTKTDIRAVLTLFMTTVETLCKEGNRINLADFLQFTPMLGGTFNSKEDAFTPHRNAIYLTTQVSRNLNARITRDALVEKVLVDASRPLLVSATDLASASDVLVMGNIIGITGKRLKFDPAITGEYLHLVNAENSAEHVNITQFYKKSDQELVFLLPKVPFTTGYFELVSSLNTATLRKGVSEPYALEAQE